MNEVIMVNGNGHAGSQVRPHDPGEPPTLPSNNRMPSSGANKAAKRRGAEPFDALLWRLEARQDEARGATTLGLIGCEECAGVTTLAANLAVRASELQLGPVLLVEADSQRPRLQRAWKLPTGPGLAELFAGDAALGVCLYDGPSSLHVLPASASRREAPAWDAASVGALLAEACADHRLVLFDLPAADRLQETVLLARRLDQVLLVVRSEATRGREAQRIVDRLAEDGVPLAGVVLNRQRSYLPRWLKRWN